MKNFFKNFFRKEAGFVLVLLVSFFCFFSCVVGVTIMGDTGTNTGGRTGGLNFNG